MTHIVGLRLKNFARFRGEHELSPLEPKPYAIVARAGEDETRSNWLGKTTVVPVALRYALFGVLPKHYETLDDVISKSADGSVIEDEMYVDVELSDGTYISRERLRGKWAKLKIVIPESTDTEQTFNQDAAQEKIIERLGLDLDNYDICADVAQKKSDRFSTMTSGQITDVVHSWVGLDQLVEAEDIASKDLGALVRELAVRDSEAARVAWAVPEKSLGLLQALADAQKSFEVATREAAKRNKLAAAYDQWTEHEARWVQADAVQNQLDGTEHERGLIDDLADLPAPSTDAEILAAEKKANEARAQLAILEPEVRSLAKTSKGLFNGACPVLPGFTCPARTEINASNEKASAAHASKLAVYEAKQKTCNDLASAVSNMRLRRRAYESLEKRVADLQALALSFKDSVDFILEHGHLPETVPTSIAVDSQPVTEANRAVAEYGLAHERRLELALSRPVLERRIAAFRIAVLALEASQRRLCEGVVQRIERGTNRRLDAAGIDLRVEWAWGRETKKLATRCSKCGAEFPASAKVKQCQVCVEPRGLKVEPKLHVRFSSRSGAAEDLAGVATSLSASRWIRDRRGAEWGVVCLDEPFASLDLAHRRALSSHLCKLVSDGVEQSFVVAHDRAVLESLPGRIEVTGDGEWSSVRVVA